MNILLIQKLNSSNTSFLKEVVDFLDKHQHKVFVEPNIYDDLFSINHLNNLFVSNLTRYDLCIVVGGDGTMINACRTWGVNGTPIIGINEGRVGFLTDISKEDWQTSLLEVITGKFKKEEREFLNINVVNKNLQLNNVIALNDFVIESFGIRKIIKYSIYINDEFMCSEYSNGIVISTSTGSTAYSLSAGGSIIHPTAKAFILSPICPQGLSSRPIVIPSDSNIKIIYNQNTEIGYTNDGMLQGTFNSDTTFSISKHPKTVTLLHPESYSYYNGLRDKLNWVS